MQFAWVGCRWGGECRLGVGGGGGGGAPESLEAQEARRVGVGWGGEAVGESHQQELEVKVQASPVFWNPCLAPRPRPCVWW